MDYSAFAWTTKRKRKKKTPQLRRCRRSKRPGVLGGGVGEKDPRIPNVDAAATSCRRQDAAPLAKACVGT